MKSTHVFDLDKTELKGLKKHLRLSSEAEVICYLIKHYETSWGKISMLDDQKYRSYIDELKNQGVMV